MKSFGFSFKAEPIWILVFSLAPGVLGLLIVLFIVLIERLLR